MNISLKTIRWHIKNIKQKLQAKSKGEIMSTAIRYGLTYILEEYDIWQNSKTKDNNMFDQNIFVK